MLFGPAPAYVVVSPLCVVVPAPTCVAVGVQGGVVGVVRTGFVVVAVHFGMLVELGQPALPGVLEPPALLHLAIAASVVVAEPSTSAAWAVFVVAAHMLCEDLSLFPISPAFARGCFVVADAVVVVVVVAAIPLVVVVVVVVAAAKPLVVVVAVALVVVVVAAIPHLPTLLAVCVVVVAVVVGAVLVWSHILPLLLIPLYRYTLCCLCPLVLFLLHCCYYFPSGLCLDVLLPWPSLSSSDPFFGPLLYMVWPFALVVVAI